ncbi:capsular polysaccharide synthesis enzyme O-acetyl transferase [Listeria cornellensis FSL F6-0969]|uniref:Capsular polysaccharide synthesis enzyme O-acetyl transferase n=1 Tax=Listeria cornellensis FSL F6-0969 TaxID=1265820 RepID=W7BKY1_9LIST|nr:capsular polysaccharide synthesis enzyme O-acetyl transferase [Listeria cornellensis FSL F6-0969]
MNLIKCRKRFPNAIVGGVPAKILKKRFEENTIENLIKEAWWDKSNP